MSQLVSLTGVSPHIARLEVRIPLGPFRLPPSLKANLYVIEGKSELCLVDCGPHSHFDRVQQAISREFGGKPITRVFLTHGHSDHAGAGRLYVYRQVPVLAGAGDFSIFQSGGPPGVPRAFRYPPFAPSHAIGEEGPVDTGGAIDLECIRAPGHTQGSVCYYAPADNALLCGDVLFGPVRRYFATFVLEFVTSLRQPSTELRQQIETVRGIQIRLDGMGDVLLLPGHGNPYRYREHRSAIARSARILQWVLRCQRLMGRGGDGASHA